MIRLCLWQKSNFIYFQKMVEHTRILIDTVEKIFFLIINRFYIPTFLITLKT